MEEPKSRHPLITIGLVVTGLFYLGAAWPLFLGSRLDQATSMRQAAAVWDFLPGISALLGTAQVCCGIAVLFRRPWASGVGLVVVALAMLPWLALLGWIVADVATHTAGVLSEHVSGIVFVGPLVLWHGGLAVGLWRAVFGAAAP